jgi:hypothetical protein
VHPGGLLEIDLVVCSLANSFFIVQPSWAQTTTAKTRDSAQLSGYSVASSKAEQDWEKKLQDGIVRENLRESMRRMSSRPHHVGSPYDKENADWILSKFKEWGFDAHLETFPALLICQLASRESHQRQ